MSILSLCILFSAIDSHLPFIKSHINLLTQKKTARSTQKDQQKQHKRNIIRKIAKCDSHVKNHNSRTKATKTFSTMKNARHA